MAPARLSSRATFIYRLVYPDLVDEVFNEGDAFLVRNKDQEDRISLSDIAAVRFGSFLFPTRVTLSLKRPSIFGTEIVFVLPDYIPYVKYVPIKELFERINAQRTP